MLLGGINLVDYDPWAGDYTDTIVEDNTIFGGFATTMVETSADRGTNPEDAFIKYAVSSGNRRQHADHSFTAGSELRWVQEPGSVTNSG